MDPIEALEDASGVVVWLVPTQTTQKVRLPTEFPHYKMIQRNKMFEPRLLVVPAGSIVEFPNNDPWLHNVFSISRSRQFDLGLYEAGVLRKVRFGRAGASYLFCSIHPEMMAVVVTVDSTYFGVSDKGGRIDIDNVPPRSIPSSRVARECHATSTRSKAASCLRRRRSPESTGDLCTSFQVEANKR